MNYVSTEQTYIESRDKWAAERYEEQNLHEDILKKMIEKGIMLVDN